MDRNEVSIVITLQMYRVSNRASVLPGISSASLGMSGFIQDMPVALMSVVLVVPTVADFHPGCPSWISECLNVAHWLWDRAMRRQAALFRSMQRVFVIVRVRAAVHT